MEEPIVALYQVGQKVKRVEPNKEVLGAIVLEFLEMNETISYRIQYDEGGEGWWCQEYVQLWTIEDTKRQMGIE